MMLMKRNLNFLSPEVVVEVGGEKEVAHDAFGKWEVEEVGGVHSAGAIVQTRRVEESGQRAHVDEDNQRFDSL